ncbi:MAG: glycosyltransferase family 4 protein [Acidobacteriota bacterium]|nr:glycosyltransferase family 4 protein [Acidobacteriota bacterium]
MQQKRTLIVYQHLPHYRLGVFRLLDNSPKLEVTFAAGKEFRDRSIPTIPFDAFHRVVPLKDLWIGPFLWQRRLLSLVLRGRFDYVVFSGDPHFISTWVAAPLARLVGSRTFHWTIGWHRPDSTRLKSLTRMIFFRLVDRVLLYGDDAYKIGVAAGFPANRLTVIGNSMPEEPPNTSNLPDETSDLQSLLPGADMKLVGAVVRVNSEKRLDMLIEAVSLLRDRGFNVGVVLTEGPATGELQSQARRLRVPLFLLGPVYRKEGLSQIYERMSVTVIPERAGLSVMQSLSRGVPVITADDPYKQVPEFRAVRQGVTGFLYRTGSVESLSSAIIDCLELLDEHGSEVAQACRDEIAKNWSPERHAANILSALG